MSANFKRLVVGLIGGLSLFFSVGITAQTFPNQPIKLVVPYPAGGATDALARMIGIKLSEGWNVPVVVENRPGAGGTIGNNYVAKAPPDGNTVLFTIVAMIQQIKLMNLPYDPINDFQPISRVATSPSIFVIQKDIPANTMAEFVKLVKANPGKYSYGSYGAGTSAHLQGSLLNLQTGMDLMHVPYPGAAPLVTAMLGGQLQSSFFDAGSSRPNLGKFKLLGVTGTQRVSWLPNVPTLKEQGFNSFEPLGWFGMFLPAKTPKLITDKYSVEIQRILKLPDVKQRIEDMGLFVGGDSIQVFTEAIKKDSEIYARIIKEANITLGN